MSDSTINEKDSEMETTHNAVPKGDLEIKDVVNKMEEHNDSQVVGWDGENDELNPMNWPAGRKWGILAIVSLMTFIT
jgi:hypothetical protein